MVKYHITVGAQLLYVIANQLAPHDFLQVYRNLIEPLKTVATAHNPAPTGENRSLLREPAGKSRYVDDRRSGNHVTHVILLATEIRSETTTANSARPNGDRRRNRYWHGENPRRRLSGPH